MKNKCKIHGADFCSACNEVSRLKKEGKHAKAKKLEKKLIKNLDEWEPFDQDLYIENGDTMGGPLSPDATEDYEGYEMSKKKSKVKLM